MNAVADAQPVDAREGLTLADAARMMRAALKDRSYRATPLGLEVARYYRWKKNEWGARPETLRDYEASLARLSLFHADLQLPDFAPPVGTERLRECWDHYWGDCAAGTRAKVRSHWVDFFDWAVRERGLHGNPARALTAPKKRGVRRDPFSDEFVDRVVSAQTYMADRLGVRLVLQYALRRAELAGVKVKDFDLERKRLVVTGKGHKVRRTPIVEEAFWRDLGVLVLEAGLGPDSSLLYHMSGSRKVRCGADEAEESLNVRGHWLHYRYRVRRLHDREITPQHAHTWWYRCLERAGLVDEDTRRGFGMHRGRHTVATEILRKTGNLVAAQRMLGHSRSSTTEEFYAQFDDADLERVLRTIRDED